MSDAHRVRLVDGWVDLHRRLVHRDGDTQRLSGREAALLAVLTGAAGRDVARGTLLEQVWSLRADTRTRTIDTTVRRLRAKVEPRPAHPQMLLTVHGVGYRWAPPPEPVDEQEEAPVLGPLARVPRDLTQFVGRERELSALEQLVPGDRVVLVGPAGVGKSHLARAAAHRWSARQACPAWWVSLDGVTCAQGAARAMAASLGVRPGDGDPMHTMDRSFARLGEGLLVLDGVDALHEAVFDRMHWPRLTVLATQRARRGAFRPFRVRPLPLDAATELFQASAPRPCDEGDDVVRTLVRRLDGLPLAITLAARRLRLLTVGQLIRRVAQGHEVLADPLHGDYVPQRMNAWWMTLSPSERSDLSALSLLDTFDLPMAELVLGPDALQRLEPLVDASWLRSDPPSFGWLDTLRAEARSHLDSSREALLWDQLAAGLNERCEAYVHPVFGARSAKAVIWLRRHRHTLSEVARRSRAPALWRAWSTSLQLLGDRQGALQVYRSPDCPPCEARSVALGDATHDSPAVHAALLLRQVADDGFAPDHLPALRRSIDALRTEGDGLGIARLATSAALAHARRGAWAAAAAARREGLDATPQPYQRAELLLAPYPLPVEEQPTQQELHQFVALSRRTGDSELEVRALVSGAFTALERSQVQLALDWAEAALHKLALVDAPRLRVGSLGNLGIVFREVAQFERAVSCFQTAARELGDEGVSAQHALILRMGWATTLLDQGHYGEARQQLEQARAVADDPRSVARIAMFSALADALDDEAGAEHALRALMADFRARGASSEAGRCALWLAAMTHDEHLLRLAESCFAGTRESERHAVVWLRSAHGHGTVDTGAPPAGSFSCQVRLVQRLSAR
jgi:DNA-binding winged helix-turn-helix (wHTH) protein/tetratricopeptide (TPR) repeat protein